MGVGCAIDTLPTAPIVSEMLPSSVVVVPPALTMTMPLSFAVVPPAAALVIVVAAEPAPTVSVSPLAPE